MAVKVVKDPMRSLVEAEFERKVEKMRKSVFKNLPSKKSEVVHHVKQSMRSVIDDSRGRPRAGL